jgi:hypothetical protein
MTGREERDTWGEGQKDNKVSWAQLANIAGRMMSDSRSSTSMSMMLLLQKLLALESYVDSDVVGEGSGATPGVGTPNANPEYDVSRTRGLVDVADPNDFGTRPVHVILIQDGVNFEG